MTVGEGEGRGLRITLGNGTASPPALPCKILQQYPPRITLGNTTTSPPALMYTEIS